MKEWIKGWKIPVGMRTIKTALAVILALSVVEQYGASPSKVVFATIGAISAVAPTFTASLLACLTQICGVTIGVLLALLMMVLNVPDMVAVGIGIILILASYQYFHLKLVPVLPCLVLVNICLNPEVEAFAYSTGRIWDTAIGLGIGLLVNTLIFPYDNSRTIRQTMIGLDQDLILFLEDMFDGDTQLPETEVLEKKIDALESQLVLFSQQRLLRRKRQKRVLQQLRSCEDTAQELLVELETLRNMEHLGCLNEENREALRALGAQVKQVCQVSPHTVEDTVVNYHVARVLHLRQELKENLTERKR
ncbi:hypothetical protein DWX58_00020 [Pseudoflavonifractor sp. AF19-9AC]|uniref:FUSC family protein n=1 Tax=Pseudoflavonifractor sp. AF19-9AC TaxID=2292244 RepID=UPI000E49D532|nr:aromatic acid exporter family protein [Pseudoflavonifractor sp. AF19-9AC]RHR10883.1 hypothetical protein DWX58_00020 [Pseudoflavonifractor sp. AF19-9AC]